MRTVTTTIDLYTFDELSPKAQEAALSQLWDINVDYDWWESTYEDAARIGLKITGFDLGRYSTVDGHFMWDAKAVAEYIIKEHGEQCETHQTALVYLAAYSELVKEQCQEEADWLCVPLKDEIDLETIKYNQEDLDTTDIDEEFLNSLREDYRIILEKEYEYLTSEEAVEETIKLNEYEFTADGTLY